MLPILGKMFEGMIQPHLCDFLDEHEVVPPQQCGFCPEKTCTHQLWRVNKYVRQQLALRRSVGMLCLDSSSAFDCVLHDLLVFKMAQAGFPPHLLKMVDSFLTGRRFRVAICQTMSQPMDMELGVPQGSVIAPTLFNIYVYDVPVPAEMELAQFADDTAYWTSSHRTATTVNRLQKASSRVVKSYSKLGVRTNGPKSMAIIFSRKWAH